MKRVLRFMKTNYYFKGFILCTSFVFPCLCITYLDGSSIIAFDYIWVAFYSSLLICLSFEGKILKVLICGFNVICVLAMTLLFLMGGAGIIPGVLWNALYPFLPNPWY